MLKRNNTILKTALLKNIASASVWLLFILTAVPVTILAFYNHPSVADDYCFAYMTRDYGFWQSQKFYYEGWSGRYISNMIFHATPLAFGIFWFVKVMPFIIFGFLYHAIFTLIGELLRPSKVHQFTLTAGFLALYIIFSASVVDTFFWYTSVFIFPSSLCYFIYFVVVILRYYQQPYQPIKAPIALLATTLVFFMVGSNEVMMLFIIAVLGMTWVYCLLVEKRFDFTLLGIMLIGLFCAYFLVIKAPGNQVRMGGSALSGDLVGAILKALISTGKQSIFWTLTLSPFLIAFSLYLQKHPIQYVSKIFDIQPFIFILGVLALVTLMFFTIHYGNTEGVPERVENIIFAFFALSAFFLLTLRKVHLPFDRLAQLNPSLVLALLLVTASLSVVIKGRNLKTMYNDLRLGIAQRYDLEMQERYTTIQKSTSDTLYLKPIQNIPKSLCFDEIKTEENHLWNKCYANYFNKKVILLKK